MWLKYIRMREKGFIQAIKKIETSLEKSIMANL
jgi:hypothetical protein